MGNQENGFEKMGSFFNERADGYDNHMEETLYDYDRYYTLLAEPIKETSEAVKILDLGCGTGIELEHIFKKCPSAHLTGMDLSEGMLQLLRDKYPEQKNQIVLYQKSYVDEELGVCQFDYVLSSMTMHHFIPEVKLGLYKKIRKALKKGCPYIEGDYMVEGSKADSLLMNYYEAVVADKEDLYHIDIPFSLETQKALLKEAGFEEISVIYHEKENVILVAR